MVRGRTARHEPRAVVTLPEFRRTFRYVPGPVAVVLIPTTGGTVHGLTCTSAASLSGDPPMTLFSVEDKTGLGEAVRESGVYSINFLASDRAEWARAFARGGAVLDRLAHVVGEGRSGVPVLRSGTTAVLECELAQVFAGGDHWIVTGHITGARSQFDVDALVYRDGRYGAFADVDGSTDRKV